VSGHIRRNAVAYLALFVARANLTPFGVADTLEPGDHQVALVQDSVTGSPTLNSFGSQQIAAIALGG
jgi:hypothetical protein